MKNELKYLQGQFALVDALDGRSPAASNSERIEFLLVRLKELKIKMYQEAGHHTPHLHIDYGKLNHVASYSIGDGRRVAGSLSSKYDRAVLEWISEHRDRLFKIWETTQSGGDPNCLIGELPGSA